MARKYARVRPRNAPMVLYRLRNDLAQREAAALAGISQREWSDLECQNQDRSFSYFNEIITNVALLLEVDETVVAPSGYQQLTVLTGLSPDELSDIEPATHDEMDDPFFVAMKRELADRMPSILFMLTYRQREIIKLRYGYDGHVYTLDEISKIFNINRERVRQVEAQAIRKLQQLA